MTTLGYFLGQIDFIETNIEFVLIAIVGLSVIPMVLELYRGNRRRRAGAS